MATTEADQICALLDINSYQRSQIAELRGRIAAIKKLAADAQEILGKLDEGGEIAKAHNLLDDIREM